MTISLLLNFDNKGRLPNIPMHFMTNIIIEFILYVCYSIYNNYYSYCPNL